MQNKIIEENNLLKQQVELLTNFVNNPSIVNNITNVSNIQNNNLIV